MNTLNKYEKFWKEFEQIHEYIYLSINHNAVDNGLHAMDKIIKRNNIECEIKINIANGFRNNLPCPEKYEQNEIVLSLKEENKKEENKKENKKEENKISPRHIIEAIYLTYNELFSEDHEIRDLWNVVKYMPRIINKSLNTMKININDNPEDEVNITADDFYFYPITTEYGKIDMVVFVEDKNGKDRYLLKEKTDDKNKQIFLGSQYIKVIIMNIIGEYMYVNYINNMEFYPNILFDKIPRIPIKDLYNTMIEKLNLSNLFTKCGRCSLSNYNIDLKTFPNKSCSKTSPNKSCSKTSPNNNMFCDNICYKEFSKENLSLEDINF